MEGGEDAARLEHCVTGNNRAHQNTVITEDCAPKYIYKNMLTSMIKEMYTLTSISNYYM